MALIDVSDLMLDPDFIDYMQLLSRVSFVDSLGQNQIEEKFFISVGSIQPASGKTLQRIPQSMIDVNMSSFWFKGTIVATEPGKYSSIVIFKSNRYQVKTVFDWSNWGAGWTEGLCVAEVPA